MENWETLIDKPPVGHLCKELLIAAQQAGAHAGLFNSCWNLLHRCSCQLHLRLVEYGNDVPTEIVS